MYWSGEENDSEKANRKKSKKHTIKERKKNIPKFLLTQVGDTILAAGTVLLLSSTVLSPSSLGMVVLGVSSFGLKKIVNAGVRYGKKHTIKKRDKSKVGAVASKTGSLAITAAGTALPIILLGIGPVPIVTAGISAIALSKATKLFKKPTIASNAKKEKEEAKKR